MQHRILVVVGILAVSALLSGCQNPVDDVVEVPSVESGEVVDSVMVKERFWGLLDDAQAVIGGEWKTFDDPLAEGCGEDHNRGFSYKAVRNHQGLVADFEVTTEALKSYWEAEGFAVRTASYAPTHRAVSVTTETGDAIYFAVDEGKVTLSGRTACYPGDAFEISNRESDEIKRERLKTTSPDPEDVG